MTWTWRISGGTLYAAGELSKPNPQAAAIGYSGAQGVSQNNPAFVRVKDVGPIPPGTYTIEAPRDTDTHGPYVLPLFASSLNEMYGRSGFLIHGDSKEHLGQASKGCIILPRSAREAIWTSGDHTLTVIA